MPGTLPCAASALRNRSAYSAKSPCMPDERTANNARFRSTKKMYEPRSKVGAWPRKAYKENPQITAFTAAEAGLSRPRVSATKHAASTEIKVMMPAK